MYVACIGAIVGLLKGTLGTRIRLAYFLIVIVIVIVSVGGLALPIRAITDISLVLLPFAIRTRMCKETG